MYLFRFLIYVCCFPILSLLGEPIYCEYSDEITNQFCDDMQKKHGLYCTANSGEFLHNINSLYISFDCIKTLSIEEGRVLIVDAIEDLLNRFNSNVKIQPYLTHYPFTHKDISMSISFITNEGKRVDSAFVALLLTCKGRIYYEKYQDNTLITMHEEYYSVIRDALIRRTAFDKIISSAQLRP